MKHPGPEIRRFAFAVSDGSLERIRAIRRREVVGYIVGTLDSADIVDEWPEEKCRWLVVSVFGGIPAKLAERLARACPHYIRGSFQVDRTRFLRLRCRG